MTKIERYRIFRNRNRECVDIIANILRAATRGAKRTHVMYRSNLSYRQLQAYLDFLLDKDFLRSESVRSSSSSLLVTTAKGHDYLRVYNKLSQLMEKPIFCIFPMLRINWNTLNFYEFHAWITTTLIITSAISYVLARAHQKRVRRSRVCASQLPKIEASEVFWY